MLFLTLIEFEIIRYRALIEDLLDLCLEAGHVMPISYAVRNSRDKYNIVSFEYIVVSHVKPASS